MDPVTFIIMLALLIGAQILIPALTPAKKPIDHIQITTSAFGEAIPFTEGNVRIAGQLVWLGELRSQVVKNKKVKMTEYYQSATYLLSESGQPIQGIPRIWADGIVFYDVRAGISPPLVTYPKIGIEVHTGAEDQEPSITEEGEEGAGNVTAGRGTVRITLKDLPLHKFGYRLPNFNFELEGGTASTAGAHPSYHPLRMGTGDPSFFPRFDAYITQQQYKYCYNDNTVFICHPKVGYASWQISKINALTGNTIISADLPAEFGTFSAVSNAINEGTNAMGLSYTGDYLYVFESYGVNLGDCKILKFNKTTLTLVHTFVLASQPYPTTGGNGACNASGTMYARFGGEGDATAYAGQTHTGTFVHVVNGNNYQRINVESLFGIVGNGYGGALFDANDRLYIYNGNSIWCFSIAANCDLTLITSRVMEVDMFTYDVTTGFIIVQSLGFGFSFDNGRTDFHFLTPGTLADAAPDTSIAKAMSFIHGIPWGGTWTKDGTYVLTRGLGSLPGAGANDFYIVNAYKATLLTIDYGATWDPVIYFVFENLPGLFYDELTGTIAGTSDIQNQVTVINDLTGNEFVIFKLPGKINLQQVTEDVLSHVNIPSADYDMSEGAPVTVRGCICVDRQSARSYLGALQPAYFFDIIEHDWKLVLRLRSNLTSVIDIPEEDTIHRSGHAGFTFTDPNGLEIPPWIDLSYFDASRDFQVGNTTVRLPIASYRSTSSGTSAQLPIIATPDEAATIGTRVLDATWAERQQMEFELSQRYLLIEPCDVVSLIRNGATFPARVGEGSVSSSFAMHFKCGAHDSAIYDATRVVRSTSSAWFKSQESLPFSVGWCAPIDAPLMRVEDDHPGIYIQTQSIDDAHTVSICEIFESPDNVNYITTNTLTYGFPVNAFPDFLASTIPVPLTRPYTTFDEETILYIFVYAGSLTTHSRDELLNDPTLNVAQWSDEILQFSSAVQLSPGYWVLTGFYRGLLGTESFVGTQTVDSYFNVIRNTDTSDLKYTAAKIVADVWYKSVDSDHVLESDGTEINQVTRRLMPFAPILRSASRSGGTITTIFHYRSRVPGQPFWSPPVFGTDQFIFEADIMSGVTVKRTIGMTDDGTGSYIDVTTDPTLPRVIYTVAAQTADFGGAQSSVVMNVYQLNSIKGRGYAGKFTV